LALPLKAHEATKRKTNQTWFSGVARDGKIIRPKAGTRKASAVFTFCTVSRSRTEDATTLSEMIPARRE